MRFRRNGNYYCQIQDISEVVYQLAHTVTHCHVTWMRATYHSIVSSVLASFRCLGYKLEIV